MPYCSLKTTLFEAIGVQRAALVVLNILRDGDPPLRNIGLTPEMVVVRDDPREPAFVRDRHEQEWTQKIGAFLDAELRAR